MSLSTGDNQPTLVLALDETLLYVSTDHMEGAISVFKESIGQTLYVVFRPGVQNFLETMSLNYSLYVFTAATQEYAEAMVELLDPQRVYISKIYSRNHTTPVANKYFGKSLQQLYTDMKRTVLLDNSLYAMLLCCDNAFPISDFNGDREDRELAKVQVELLKIRQMEDLRVYLKSQFNIREKCEAFLTKWWEFAY